MYILEVKNFEGTKATYFRAKTLTEAKLFQMSSANYVNIYTAHEFLSILPQVDVGNKSKDNFDVTL
jgi:hypothetical protein